MRWVITKPQMVLTLLGELWSPTPAGREVNFPSRSGTPPEEGALSEADEQTLLQYIAQNPGDYPALWQQIQALPGLSQKEYDEFAAANPANAPSAKRSLSDLD